MCVFCAVAGLGEWYASGRGARCIGVQPGAAVVVGARACRCGQGQSVWRREVRNRKKAVLCLARPPRPSMAGLSPLAAALDGLDLLEDRLPLLEERVDLLLHRLDEFCEGRAIRPEVLPAVPLL